MKNKFISLITLIILSFSVQGQSFFTLASGSSVSDSPVEVGVKFTASDSGTITSLRFYKGRSDLNNYVLKLYGGTSLLASVNYQGSTIGWISVPIPAVTVRPGVNYVASYFSPAGIYQAINPFLGWPAKVGPLTATGSVYQYKSGNNSVLPVNSYQSSNYFADVVFENIAPVVKDTVRDTIRIPVLVKDSAWSVTYVDSLVRYGAIDFSKYYANDTAQFVIGLDALDTTNYLEYIKKLRFFWIWEITNYADPSHKMRVVEYFKKAMRKEESNDGGLTWQIVIE